MTYTTHDTIPQNLKSPTHRLPEGVRDERPDLVAALGNIPNNQHLQLAGQLIINSARGENPRRDGLVRTPERYAKAMSFLLSGYEEDPESIVGKGIFNAESRGVVSINGVEFFSLCEHHMLPFWGKVSVAYYPHDQIIGLSKIPRLVNTFARRLQVQEHLTQQIGQSLMDLIKPRAVAVRVSGQHLCMMMRGVEKQNSHTISERSFGLESLTNLEQQRLFSALEG